jgi:hypothetical protein
VLNTVLCIPAGDDWSRLVIGVRRRSSSRCTISSKEAGRGGLTQTRRTPEVPVRFTGCTSLCRSDVFDFLR